MTLSQTIHLGSMHNPHAEASYSVISNSPPHRLETNQFDLLAGVGWPLQRRDA